MTPSLDPATPQKIPPPPPSNQERAAEIAEEKRMLEGLYEGNKKVARAFMEKYAPYVHAVAVKVRTRDPSWAFEDLVSEAFLHLFE